MMNRRSGKELENVQSENREVTYGLQEQKNFTGDENQLRYMQDLERAYIDGFPKVSDEEWDILKERFHYEESIFSVAPSGRQWVKMEAPLPSVDKAGNMEELNAFMSRFPGEEFIVECKLDGLTLNQTYVLNGDSYSLECLATRGNGRYGMTLKPFALEGVHLGGVPRSIDVKYVQKICGSLPQRFEIRGEAVIPKVHYGLRRYDQGFEPVVWRSMASGMLTREVPNNLEGVVKYLYGDGSEEVKNFGKSSIVVDDREKAKLVVTLVNDPHKLGKNDTVIVTEGKGVLIKHSDGVQFEQRPDEEFLDVISYSCSVDGLNLDLHSLKEIPGLMHVSDVLLENGTLSPVYCVTSDPYEIRKRVALLYGTDLEGKRDVQLPRLRNMHGYAVDGVVVKLKNTDKVKQGLQPRMSRGKLVIPKYPDDSIAVKLLSETVRVKLERIVKKKTSLGNVMCQGVLDKAYRTESGAMVDSVNLNNERWLEENSWICEGEYYDLCMVMDVRPTLLMNKR